MEIHQKKAGPDYHRLKTMVQEKYRAGNLRIKHSEAGNGNYETNAVVKNQGTKQREQRTLGDCWQWESQRAVCLKETIAVSVTMSISVQNRHSRILLRVLLRGRMREMRREPEVPEARVQWQCSMALQGLPQRNLQRTHFCEKWHPPECLFYKTQEWLSDLGKSALIRIIQVDEQPTKRSKTNNDKSAVAMLKKGNWQERELVTDGCHDDRGNL